MRVIRAIIATCLVCGSGLPLHAALVNGIKAIVHDAVITYQEVDVDTASAADDLRRQYRNDREGYQKKLSEVLNDNMQQLIEGQLILHEFNTAGYALPESIIDEEVQRFVARAGGRAILIKSLQAQGTTYEKFRQKQRDRIIIQALRGKNVNSEIMISPHKIETYYLNHQDEFKVDDQVKLRMIVITNSPADDTQSRQMAQEVLAKIKEGATFSEMASVYSQGSQRSQGGDWGWVERPVLRKELAEVAFTLTPGEPSNVIETPEACYLMLVEEKKPAHVKGLSEVRDEIDQTLLRGERARVQKQWIDRLRKKTFVRYF